MRGIAHQKCRPHWIISTTLYRSPKKWKIFCALSHVLPTVKRITGRYKKNAFSKADDKFIDADWYIYNWSVSDLSREFFQGHALSPRAAKNDIHPDVRSFIIFQTHTTPRPASLCDCICSNREWWTDEQTIERLLFFIELPMQWNFVRIMAKIACVLLITWNTFSNIRISLRTKERKKKTLPKTIFVRKCTYRQCTHHNFPQ